MYEKDRAPVRLTEICHQYYACQRSIERGEEHRRIFPKFLTLENYTDIVITGCGSSHDLAMCASFAWSEMLKKTGYRGCVF